MMFHYISTSKDVIGWKDQNGMWVFSNATDWDSSTTDGVNFTDSPDSFSYAWDLSSVGINDTITIPSVELIGLNTPGVFRIYCTVNDILTIPQSESGYRNDTSGTQAYKDIIVVQADINTNTGLADTGYDNDAENTSPGRIIGKNDDGDQTGSETI